MGNTTVRIRFSKSGDVRWISHRDLARVWERLLRRAGLSLAFSEGFHPRPKISFPSALAVGIVALEEIVEMDLVGLIDAEETRRVIAEQLPEGMVLLGLELLVAGASRAVMAAASYEIHLLPADAQAATERLGQLRHEGKVTVQRDAKTLEASFAQSQFQIDCEGNVLRFTLPATAQGSLRPSELLAALNIAHALSDGAVLTRTRVHLALDRSRAGVGGEISPAALATGHSN